ncbi:MAG: DEAD/DEAH box helicase [Candidatus Eisenbacteria bacterium]|uniref:DEAD/DEAH box helicase n=1 Tax=Eiseniibacteriota bacterium TaxID=2212470 RepID=A0A849SH82_UNCEI|nr:DEAD/DEAH box helicase [Candidatus Eisenbacteria bacterium]
MQARSSTPSGSVGQRVASELSPRTRMGPEVRGATSSTLPLERFHRALIHNRFRERVQEPVVTKTSSRCPPARQARDSQLGYGSAAEVAADLRASTNPGGGPAADWGQSTMTFEQLEVRPELIAALAKQGITEPTAIQIQRQCTDLTQNTGWPIRVLLLIGGTSIERQIDKLKMKPHLVVGSPGRILELITMGRLKTPAIRWIVIDEADRLMVTESLPAIRAIIAAAPRARQLIFASATEQPASEEAIATLAPDRVMLQAGAVAVNENIEHFYLVCELRDEPETLRKLLHALHPERAMVFVHRNERAENLSAKLAHHHIEVADLHGAADKRDRKQAMDDFRGGRVRVLVASDVGARGLDIKGSSGNRVGAFTA